MPANSSDADVIVIGLGIHGSATAASLARRGRRVIAMDRFAADHVRGSSHGRTRMIRRAYPNPVWNDLVDGAYRGWESLENETGQTLLHTTGGLYAHAGDSQLQGPDCVLVEDRDELHRLMPDFRVPDGYRAVYDPHAGVVEASRALAAMRSVATGLGADLRYDERLLGWRATQDGVEVQTDAGTLHGDRLVIAAGSFTPSIVPQLAPLLEIWRILTVTVTAGQTRGRPPGLGAFSVDRDGGLIFGIPDVDGNGVKLGVDARRVWDPEVPVAAPTAAEIAGMLALLEEYVPGLAHAAVDATACLYTMTEDKRFVIGALAEAPQVVVVSACSGHGFKFAPTIGDAAADLADGIVRDDLDFVSTARRGI